MDFPNREPYQKIMNNGNLKGGAALYQLELLTYIAKMLEYLVKRKCL